MKIYTRELGKLRAVEFSDDSTIDKALDLINVKHMAMRQLKAVGVNPDKRAPILLCINNCEFNEPDMPIGA